MVTKMFLKQFYCLLIGIVFQGCIHGAVVHRCPGLDDETAFPNRVDFVGCEDDTVPCKITNYIEFEMEFIAQSYLGKIAPQIGFIVDGVEVDPILPQKDACEGVTIALCPIINSDLVIYSFNMTIPDDSLPPNTVTGIKFSIINLDVEETPAVCFLLDCVN